MPYSICCFAYFSVPLQYRIVAGIYNRCSRACPLGGVGGCAFRAIIGGQPVKADVTTPKTKLRRLRRNMSNKSSLRQNFRLVLPHHRLAGVMSNRTRGNGCTTSSVTDRGCTYSVILVTVGEAPGLEAFLDTHATNHFAEGRSHE
jgi:hypothetical protein